MQPQRFVVTLIALLLVLATGLIQPTRLYAQHDNNYAGEYWAGDADGVDWFTSADIILLVNFVFRSGEGPQPYYLQGDANCDGRVTTADIIVLVNVVFRGRGRLCWFYGRYFADTTGLLEAQLMALAYAETLEPPTDLTNRFQSDLRRIRTELPPLNGLFMSERWATTSFIILSMDSASAYAIVDSSYSHWDSLNMALDLDSVWIWSWKDGWWYDFFLRFHGLKNPIVIAALYATLPGVIYATENGMVGESPHDVWPYSYGDTTTYVFKQAWGDCPAGCVWKRFYYVGATPDTVWFIGGWLWDGNPPPPWWSAACDNLNRSDISFLCDE